MARELIIRLTDDLDRRGGLHTEAAETVTFGWKGRWYEIDLSEDHVAELEEFITGYVQAARSTDSEESYGGVQVQSGAHLGARRFKAMAREWGKQDGRWPDVEPGGYHPREMLRAFEEHLKNEARRTPARA